jgi:MFS family permease
MRSIEGGLEGPFGGMLIDKYGPRKITIISTIIGSLGLLMVLFVRDIWQFVFIWGFVVSLGFNLGLYDTVNAAVAKWFVKKRGRAISLVTIGGGPGAPVVVPVMTWIIINHGWRLALIFIALSTFVVCLPLAWFWVRDHPPEHYGLLPDGDTVIKGWSDEGEAGEVYEEFEFNPKQALRTHSFWMVLIAFALSGGITAAVTMHQIPYLLDMGIDPLAAVGILGLMATMSLPGRVVFAWVGDRWGGEEVSDRRLRFEDCRCLDLDRREGSSHDHAVRCPLRNRLRGDHPCLHLSQGELLRPEGVRHHHRVHHLLHRDNQHSLPYSRGGRTMSRGATWGPSR